MNKNFYSLGLMSGTSMDGIDASIIKSDGEQILEIIDNVYLKYDEQLKSELKPIDLLETSFAIIQSQFFSINLFFEFSTKLLVSAAKPITSFGLRELCFET